MNSDADADVDSPADRALKQMARGVVPVEDQRRLAELRARLVPSLGAFAGAAFEARRRRRWWTLTAVAAAAAAVVLAGSIRLLGPDERVAKPPFASLHADRGNVILTRAGAVPGTIGSATVELAARDRVETTDAGAQVNLSSGALVELDAKTSLELGPSAASEERVALAIGKIDVRVPKLPPGKTLSIGTPNATITVHGTAFEVVVRSIEGGGTSTSVMVTEGRVGVQSDGRDVFLGPGASWSSVAAPASPAPSGTEAPEEKKETAPRAGPPPSTLAEENMQFRSAMAARLEGKPSAAVQILDRLLASHPDTPLADAVRAERARALADLDKARATPGR